MGHNTTVVVLNDSLDAIANDPNFGKKLVDAILKCGSRSVEQTVSAGYHSNAAIVIESHHADTDVLVTVGGNTGKVFGTKYGLDVYAKEYKDIKLVKPTQS